MEAQGLQVSKGRLHKRDLNPDPLAQFEVWFAVAKIKSGLPDPNAFALASRSVDDWPEVRIVLLKSADARGYTFYTNLESDKGRGILAYPKVEMNFHWNSLGRQVRIRGTATQLKDAEADQYFASRARASQIAAWASQQSRVAPERKTMEKHYEEIEREYEGKEVPRPPYWSGFRVAPERYEFWQADPNRFHDRFRYTKEEGHWKISRIYP